MGNLKFGEQSTKDLGLVIQAPPVYEFPAKEVTITHIPGRNGDIVIDTDSFKNVTRTYSIASVFKPGTDFVANSEKIIKWLTSKEGYQRLEDSYDPEVYRLAVFKNNGSLQNYYDEATALNITFECKPQRYLKVGEKEVFIESSEMTIKNPTVMSSLPKIKLEGINTGIDNKKVVMCSIKDKNDKVTSNITLSDLDSTTVILDSEKQTAEDASGKNISKSVGLNGSTFPKFKEGINKIKIEKYTELPLSIEAYQNLINNTKKALIARYKPYNDLVESKQSKVTIKSWKRLIEDTQEEYDSEAYQLLMLENSSYFEYDDMNTILEYIGYNIQISDNFDDDPYLKEYINYVIYDEDLGKYRWYDDTIKKLGGCIILAESVEYGTTYVFICNNQASGNSTYVFMKTYSESKAEYNSEYIFSCWAQPDDYFTNQNTINAIGWGDAIQSDLGYVLVNGNLISTKNRLFTNRYDETENINSIILSIYQTTTLGSQEIDLSMIVQPDFMEIQPVYKDTTRGGQTFKYIESINYVTKKVGYFYKETGGILKYIPPVISSVLSSSGWSHASSTNLVLENIKWSNNKHAFISNSTFSSSTEYSIKRNFIETLPQYPDIELKDVYELDANGNVRKDSAGNDIHKFIKNRVIITGINNNASEVTGLKAKFTGYYRFNDNDTWIYKEANESFTNLSSLGYNVKTTKSNNIYYLETVPNYSTEKDYPDWLDIDPILYDSTDNIVTGVSALNASKYDLKVTKAAWYWYNFVENDILKITNHEIRTSGNVIGNISPDENTHRDVSSDFTLYEIDLDENNPEVFPIHEYEYVEATDNQNLIYLPNVKGNTLFEFNINSTYHKDDYCLHTESSIESIYKCIVDVINPGNSFNSSQWEIQNNLVSLEADEYNSEETYDQNDYCIYDRSLWICIVAISTPEEFTESHWSKCGDYIKNIGFFDLTSDGIEEEYKLNIPPEWLIVHINRGLSDDYSDTVLEYKVLNASSSNYNYYIWNEKTAWIKWSKKEDPEDPIITTELYKTDTSIFMMEELPTYDFNNYREEGDSHDYNDNYTYEVIESENGNPEFINFKVKSDADGYYKVGSSSNYKYYSEADVLDSVRIDQKLDIVYLEQDTDQMSGVTISVIPRWWSL